MNIISEDNLRKLLTAIKNDDKETVLALIKDVNFDAIISPDDHKLAIRAPLYCAITANRTEIANLLIIAGADITSARRYVLFDGDRFSICHIAPIHLAAIEGDLGVIKSILSINPEQIENTTDLNDTPLQLASQKGHIEVVEYLLERQHIKKTLPDWARENNYEKLFYAFITRELNKLELKQIKLTPKSIKNLLNFIKTPEQAVNFIMSDPSKIAFLLKNPKTKVLISEALIIPTYASNLLHSLEPDLLQQHEKALLDLFIQKKCNFFERALCSIFPVFKETIRKHYGFQLIRNSIIKNDGKEDLILGYIALSGLFNQSISKNVALAYFRNITPSNTNSLTNYLNAQDEAALICMDKEDFQNASLYCDNVIKGGVRYAAFFKNKLPKKAIQNVTDQLIRVVDYKNCIKKVNNDNTEEYIKNLIENETVQYDKEVVLSNCTINTRSAYWEVFGPQTSSQSTNLSDQDVVDSILRAATF